VLLQVDLSLCRVSRRLTCRTRNLQFRGPRLAAQGVQAAPEMNTSLLYSADLATASLFAAATWIDVAIPGVIGLILALSAKQAKHRKCGFALLCVAGIYYFILLGSTFQSRAQQSHHETGQEISSGIN